MPQRVKTCSVFDSRSMTIDYYSLFTHIVYKSGPGGAGRSDGNPLGRWVGLPSGRCRLQKKRPGCHICPAFAFCKYDNLWLWPGTKSRGGEQNNTFEKSRGILF